MIVGHVAFVTLKMKLFDSVDRNGELVLIETEIWTKRCIHSKVVCIHRKSAIQRSAIVRGIIVTLRGFGKYLSKGNRI